MNKLQRQYYLAGAVSLITFLVYLSALRNGFVNWDDYEYVVDNPHIRLLNWDLFRWPFSAFYAGNWHPLTWMSHALDYAAWGLNPSGHHLTNNILHAVNTFVVVLLVIKLLTSSQADKLKSSLDTRFTLIAAGATGLLFGLHPLHVESVAWVSERKDLLCAMFFLLSILVYVRYVAVITPPSPSYLKRGWQSRGRYFLSFGFFILALLSKPMAITLPAVLLILDWYPLRRIGPEALFRKALAEKLPFIGFSVVASLLTFAAQKESGAMLPLEAVPLSVRSLVAVKALVLYLWKMAAPLDLVPFYPYPESKSFSLLSFIAPAILVIGITVVCIYVMNKRRLFLSIWGCYVIALTPVLGIVQVGEQAMADRYAYLPSLGPFLLIGLGTAWLWQMADSPDKWGPAVKGVLAVVGASLCISLSYLDVKQIGIWKNSMTLWNYVIAKEPDTVPFAYNNRGNAFKETGRLKQALEDYTTAVTLDSGQYRAFHNRGLVFMETGELDLALQDYNSAIAINPNYAEAYNNRGIVFRKMGRLDKAIEDYSKAITMDPEQYRAYNNRGIAYAETGHFDRAVVDFTRAIALNPLDYDLAYLNRGITFSKMGRLDEAMRDYQKACDLGSEEACESLRANTSR